MEFLTDVRRIEAANNQTTTSSNVSIDKTFIEYLKSMSDTLNQIAKNTQGTSQSAARNALPTKDEFRKRAEEAQKQKKNFRSTGRPFDDFFDSFEDSLIEGILGAGFKDQISTIFKDIAGDIGLELKDLPGAIGKHIGNQAINAFKNTKLGKSITNQINNTVNSVLNDLKSNSYKNSHNASNVKDVADRAVNTSSSNARNAPNISDAIEVGQSLQTTSALVSTSSTSSTVASTAAAGAGVGAGIASAIPQIAVVVGAIMLISAFADAIEPATKGIQDFASSLSKAASRSISSRRDKQENEIKRFTEDINAIIREPFRILEDAAQKIYDVWDNNLRVINATQGYSKADLQNLMSAYSSRLIDENLSHVISSTSITESLAKVLNSGLSGVIAEEFAYIATKLNAAVPTQDFFDYGDVYATIAANAMAAGESQAEAIAAANEQLEAFASNILYSSRQLTNGVASGLNNAKSIFESSVQISNAAKTYNSSQLSGLLTSISAVVGSIAPDLASSITDAVIKSATGGNSPELVALRSLAGGNASNTEFLQRLARNPQEVFTTLFKNLAKQQTMSDSNYMEVAEGLSKIYGISMDAFARVDFNYLANAVEEMKVNMSSLEENIKHLESGETTTTAEQLKIAQINKYQLEQGLSYVLDNEVARAIQQHMWDEQLANTMMEATYGVEVQGDALRLIESLAAVGQAVFNLLSGRWIFNAFSNMYESTVEGNALNEDIKQVLELTKVGQGNVDSLSKLTTRGIDLNLTPGLITLLGGESEYERLSKEHKIERDSRNMITSAFDEYTLSKATETAKQSKTNGIDISKHTSRYNWGSVGKSYFGLLDSIFGLFKSDKSYATLSTPNQTDTSKLAQSRIKASLDQMLSSDYISKFVSEGKSYEDWANSAKSFGIGNISTALDDVGYSEEKARLLFNESQSKYVTEQESKRKADEELFWQNTSQSLSNIDNIRFDETHNLMVELNDKTNMMLSTINTNTQTWMDKIYSKEAQFYDEWVKYFVEHSVYKSSYNHSDVDRIKNDQNAEQSASIYALAEALTQSTVDLKDPTIQTNALLSQILLVLNSIMQSTNTKSSVGTSLVEELNALAMGLIK